MQRAIVGPLPNQNGTESQATPQATRHTGSFINMVETDKFYRYTMPDLELKHETNFTVIVNVDKVVKSLKRSKESLYKYIGIKLSTMTTSKGIRGQWSYDDIRRVVASFIKDVVLCSHCSNPETEWRGNKLGCYACGKIIRLTQTGIIWPR